MFRQSLRRVLYRFDRDLRLGDKSALAAAATRAGELVCADCDDAGPAGSADAAVADIAGSIR